MCIFPKKSDPIITNTHPITPCHAEEKHAPTSKPEPNLEYHQTHHFKMIINRIRTMMRMTMIVIDMLSFAFLATVPSCFLALSSDD